MKLMGAEEVRKIRGFILDTERGSRLLQHASSHLGRRLKLKPNDCDNVSQQLIMRLYLVCRAELDAYDFLIQEHECAENV